MFRGLNLSNVHLELWNQAIEAYDNADAAGFVISAISNQHALGLIVNNVAALKRRGIYEKCLLLAFVSCRVNNRDWPEHMLQWLFSVANRKKLRSAGAPLPQAGPFVLYRGIAGHGRARRPRGFSWTSSLPIACWFAQRLGLPKPTVISTKVQASDVLAFIKDRTEDEFIIEPTWYERVTLNAAEIDRLAHERMATVAARNNARKKRGLTVNMGGVFAAS